MEDSDQAERQTVQTEQQAHEEGVWMARELTTIAAVSIGATLLLVVGLLLFTYVGVFAVASTEIVAWGVGFLALFAVAVAAFAWGRGQ